MAQLSILVLISMLIGNLNLLPTFGVRGLETGTVQDRSQDRSWNWAGAVRIYFDVRAEEFENAFEETAKELGIELQQGSALDGMKQVQIAIGGNDNIQAVWVSEGTRKEVDLAFGIGEKLNKTWMQVFYRDDQPWEYELLREGVTVDYFCTCFDYWDDEAENPPIDPKYRSRAQLLAEFTSAWEDAIERYLFEWPMIEVGSGIFEYDIEGKAYESDEHRYGENWQAIDFMKALGCPPVEINRTIFVKD